MLNGGGGGTKSAKERTSRSGSGIPHQSASSSLQRNGGVNGIINNISSGIAQKKQMLKGIWSRGSSQGNNTALNKNENIDPSNIVVNRGQSMDIPNASTKIGMGTNHLKMSHTGSNMMQFRNQKPIGGGKSELIDQGNGTGALSSSI